MPATSAIDIVSDANVALKWFHAAGEEEVEAARALLAGQPSRSAGICQILFHKTQQRLDECFTRVSILGDEQCADEQRAGP